MYQEFRNPRKPNPPEMYQGLLLDGPKNLQRGLQA